MNHLLPLPYRWFLNKGLTNWQPWYFVDLDSPSRETTDFLQQQFLLESGADFDVYLFARRQDMDDFAFFVVKDGVIEDKVICFHLSFAKKLELAVPLQYSNINRTFLQWIEKIVLPEVAEWISEEDLDDDD
jgi:hypothetical protein